MTARIKLLPVVFCSLLLAACEPTLANRGHMLEPEKLAEIKVDSSTREDVVNKLGSPSQVSTFDENIWYYFGRQTEQYSFLDPEILKQQAVEVRFNDQGVVSAVNNLDTKQARSIEPVDRRTPTYGHETTIVEQLIGNLGHPGIRAKNNNR